MTRMASNHTSLAAAVGAILLLLQNHPTTAAVWLQTPFSWSP